MNCRSAGPLRLIESRVACAFSLVNARHRLSHGARSLLCLAATALAERLKEHGDERSGGAHRARATGATGPMVDAASRPAEPAGEEDGCGRVRAPREGGWRRAAAQ